MSTGVYIMQSNMVGWGGGYVGMASECEKKNGVKRISLGHELKKNLHE